MLHLLDGMELNPRQLFSDISLYRNLLQSMHIAYYENYR